MASGRNAPRSGKLKNTGKKTNPLESASKHLGATGKVIREAGSKTFPKRTPAEAKGSSKKTTPARTTAPMTTSKRTIKRSPAVSVSSKMPEGSKYEASKTTVKGSPGMSRKPKPAATRAKATGPKGGMAKKTATPKKSSVTLMTPAAAKKARQAKMDMAVKKGRTASASPKKKKGGKNLKGYDSYKSFMG